MDLSMLRTMLVPVILGFFLYRKVTGFMGSLVLLTVFLFVNGLILYIPQFLPSGNRDSRTLSRIEGLLMGLGGMVSVVNGVVTLLPTTFEWAEEIDISRAEASEARAQEVLQSKDASDGELVLAKARLKRALVRKSVANRK